MQSTPPLPLSLMGNSEKSTDTVLLPLFSSLTVSRPAGLPCRPERTGPTADSTARETAAKAGQERLSLLVRDSAEKCEQRHIAGTDFLVLFSTLP